jgi:hypothetical protein
VEMNVTVAVVEEMSLHRLMWHEFHWVRVGSGGRQSGGG